MIQQQRSIRILFYILLGWTSTTQRVVFATIDCGELQPDVCPLISSYDNNTNTFLCDEDKDGCYFKSIINVEGRSSLCKSLPSPPGTKSFVSLMIDTNIADPGGLVCLRSKIFFNEDLTEPHGMTCQGKTACEDATIVTGPNGYVVCKVSGENTDNATSVETAPCTSSGYLFPDSEIGAMVVISGCLYCRDAYSCGENVVFIDAGVPGNAFQIVPNNFIGFMGSGCPPKDSNALGCFSSHNTIYVRGKGFQSIDSLEVGDYVKTTITGKGEEFSRVISFMHKDRNTKVQYLQIFTDDLDMPIEVTPEHLLFTADGRIIKAQDVRVGDVLDSHGTIVTDIQTIQRHGMFAPLTESGEIVVSGIHSSCYVAVLDDDIVPTFLQAHVLHATLAPLRVVCAFDFTICQNDEYTIDGFSTNIKYVIQFGLKLVELDRAFQWMLFILALPLLLLLSALEVICYHGFTAVLTTGFMVAHKSIARKKSWSFWGESQISAWFRKRK